MPPKKLAADGKHEFWDTQPVPKIDESISDEGPMESRTLADVPPDPYPIASVLEWWTPNMNDENDLKSVYELLAGNYVEDDDSIFRFNYSCDFLRWATTPPGYFPDWMVAVRKKGTTTPLAFISGIPIEVRLGDKVMQLCEINFLCIHKVLRSKRLAPILIKEVTRRVNLKNIWQAVYTAGIDLPKAFVTCQYYHRNLNPEKLVGIGFSRVPQQFNKMQRPMEAFKRTLALPDKPVSETIRPMTEADVPQVTALLDQQLAKYKVAPKMSQADVSHWILPKPGVVQSFVITDKHNPEVITDFISFYALPSTVLGNAKYNDLRAAYCFYYANTKTELKQLMGDAVIIAKNSGFDVFNLLAIMDNGEITTDLKFNQGDGFLRYYLYNWKFPSIEPKNVGLVML